LETIAKATERSEPTEETMGGGSEVLVAASNSLAMRESGRGYWMQDEVAGSLRAEGENRPSRPSNVIASGLPETVGALTDGAHQGGGLTDKMPTRAAYSPALANPLTARMGKGINTTLDEGQTAIVCQGEEIK
jgi:hypothetical protein